MALPHRRGRLLSAASVFLVAVPLSAAQSNWVDFQDETATRLQLSTVPANDPEEKDIAVGDLDRDGDDDIVVVRKTPFSNQGPFPNVLLMNENGVLVDRTQQLIPDFLIADDARDVTLVDVDQDGRLDIVDANTFSQDPRLFVNQGEDANGDFLGFSEDTNWFSPPFPVGAKFCAVSGGDVTGDGFPDLFFSDYNNALEDRLLVNDGTGHFIDETDARLGSNKVSAFGTGNVIADFNGDGWNDIVKITTLFSPSGLWFLPNDGTGHFPLKQELPYQAVYMLDAADFNSDGRLDLYVESDNQDYLLINQATNPNGTISVLNVPNTNSQKTGQISGNTHHADLDRDGYQDAGIADVDVDIPGCNRRFAAVRNRMPQQLGMEDPNNPANLAWNSQGTHDFAFLDLNGDGFTDMFQALCSGYKVFMMQPFAAAEPLGGGCSGTSGVPALTASGKPQLGNPNFRIALSGAKPGAVPVLFVGASKSSTDLGNGCQLQVGLPALLQFSGPAVAANGNLLLTVGIPSDPTLEGLDLFMQYAIPDPAGQSPLGGGVSASTLMELYLSANSF